MKHRQALSALAALAVRRCSAVTYNPFDFSGNKSSQLDPAPVGLSFEFFAFPEYVSDVPATAPCLAHLADAMGSPAPIRIGGTTQDRAAYDPGLASAVAYNVASTADAPESLTYGPAFFDLAAGLDAPTVVGLNRRLNNISNTITAARRAVSAMDNLFAIELGNEPEFYGSSAPIAVNGSWTPELDVQSQVSWQASVGSALGATDLFEAGVYLSPPTWSIAKLAPAEGASARYVKDFCGHSYPQSACGGASTSLARLMSHSGIVEYTAQYAAEVAAAQALNKEYVLGETNSATCGGGGISPTFGAALWIVDYVMQAMLVGVKRLYFHQGTIGNCQYCWWGRYSMGAPYYGAVFAAEALGGADYVAMLDDGTTPYAAYAFYNGSTPVRVLLYNSDYYDASSARSYQNYTLSGFPSGSTTTAAAKRLTAPSAASRQDRGGNPTLAGRTFANGTCATSAGAETIESVAVVNGSATFSVGASEALLVAL